MTVERDSDRAEDVYCLCAYLLHISIGSGYISPGSFVTNPQELARGRQICATLLSSGLEEGEIQHMMRMISRAHGIEYIGPDEVPSVEQLVQELQDDIPYPQ